jgi:phosphotriesterase-related protein
MNSRRKFVQACLAVISSLTVRDLFAHAVPKTIHTVAGPVDARTIGITLIHEHILVDFIGAEKIHPGRWDHEAVIKKMLPYLTEVKAAGCKTLVDCTPNYLGRDAKLLNKLSALSGLNIVTNTGFYGGSDHKFLPSVVFDESTEQLAERWTKEFQRGITDAVIRPGLIKISVNNTTLSPISKKLITAAALTHLETGLTIASHTGTAVPALEQIDILKTMGVSASAFIWVHAQNEPDLSQYLRAVQQGCWISLDGVNDDNIAQYVDVLLFMKRSNSLHRTLISHDAGWYDPEKPDGPIRKFTTIFNALVPALKQRGFDKSEVRRLLEINPAEALSVRVRAFSMTKKRQN